MSMIDAASGGALVDKTPTEAMNLIANMASNSQQFKVRTDVLVRGVNEVGATSSLDRQLANLTQVVQTLASSIVSMHSKPCGICSILGHLTDMCPTLQEGGLEQANALGYQGPSTYQGQGPSWPKYDPYSSTYNSGWNNHPNLSYGNQHQNTPPPTLLQHNRPPDFQQPRNFAPTHTNNLPFTHP